MTETSDSFVNSLLSVAKELKKIHEIREFRKEFENEIANQSVASSDREMKDSENNQNNQSSSDHQNTLHMEVYEDKDYDIEEIKYWNFRSKLNKSVKSNTVRTIVYKVPESSYIVKKVYVKIKSSTSGTNKQTNVDESSSSSTLSTAPADQSTQQVVAESISTTLQSLSNQVSLSPSKPAIAKRAPGRPPKFKAAENTIKQETSKPTIPTSSSSGITSTALSKEKETKKSANSIEQKLNLFNKSSLNLANNNNKYNAEDIILIDEDDDIIDYDEYDEELIQINNENKCGGGLMVRGQDTSDEDEPMETDKEKENEVEATTDEEQVNDADEEDADDEEYSSAMAYKKKLQRKYESSQAKKPKIVIEKAEEPVSTIKIQASTRTSRNKLSKPLNQVSTRKSQIGSEKSVKKTKEIGPNEIQTTEKLRVTRSKAKLIDNK